MRFKKIAVNKIKQLYDKEVTLTEGFSEQELNQLLTSIDASSLEVLDTGFSRRGGR